MLRSAYMSRSIDSRLSSSIRHMVFMYSRDKAWHFNAIRISSGHSFRHLGAYKFGLEAKHVLGVSYDLCSRSQSRVYIIGLGHELMLRAGLK